MTATYISERGPGTFASKVKFRIEQKREEFESKLVKVVDKVTP